MENNINYIESKIIRIQKLMSQDADMIEAFMKHQRSVLECGEQFGRILNHYSSINYELTDLLNNIPKSTDA
jgi:Mg2+ and Co2+ transporter CorA